MEIPFPCLVVIALIPTSSIALGAVAVFVQNDTTTQGTWIGTYGTDGCQMAGVTAFLPDYVSSMTTSGASTRTWREAGEQTEDLQKPAPATDRIAAAWWSFDAFTMNVIMNGVPHKVALYCEDPDTTARRQKIEIIDPGTSAVLDTQTLDSRFDQGVWLQWNIAGSVQIKVTRTGGAGAVVCGIFFDPGVGMYDITTSAGAGGSISPTGTVPILAGGNRTFGISPNVGCAVSDVVVDAGAGSETHPGAVTTYTFEAVTADHTIAVSFIPAEDLLMSVIEQHPEPVIKEGDPGTEGNKYGFEGGSVLKLEGVYHLFTAERIGDPYLVNMRLGHWTSPDRVTWTRSDTMMECSADRAGIDLKSNVWAPMPFFDEENDVWNVYYVAYRSKPDDDTGWYCNYDGRIIRAVSQTPGRSGINGPWKDIGIALEPAWEPWKEDGSQPWEGLQGTDSMSPPYKVEGRWLAFYGSAQTQNNKNPAYPKWSIGLAEAPAKTGPWKRLPKGNPIPFNSFCENPIVTKLPDGSYVMVFDAAAIGYAWSPDGLRWSELKTLKMPKTWWSDRIRTPLGAVPESDGTYTIFFMGKQKRNWQELGFVRVTLEKKTM